MKMSFKSNKPLLSPASVEDHADSAAGGGNSVVHTGSSTVGTNRAAKTWLNELLKRPAVPKVTGSEVGTPTERKIPIEVSCPKPRSPFVEQCYSDRPRSYAPSPDTRFQTFRQGYL